MNSSVSVCIQRLAIDSKLAGCAVGEDTSKNSGAPPWHSQEFSLVDIYSENIELDPEFLKTVFDILVDLLPCSAIAIQHLRKNDIETATAVVSWGGVRTKFTTFLKILPTRPIS